MLSRFMDEKVFSKLVSEFDLKTAMDVMFLDSASCFLSSQLTFEDIVKTYEIDQTAVDVWDAYIRYLLHRGFGAITQAEDFVDSIWHYVR